MVTFAEFKKWRYWMPPYDIPINPVGFPDRPSSSNISAHLPFLELLARQCDNVVEFGVGEAFSTSAFISGAKHTISYDIEVTNAIKELQQMELPNKWTFHQQSIIESGMVIPVCDMLFFDTVHTYEHVKQALAMHAHQVKRWLLFHDIFSFPEINQAIDEFMIANPKWVKVYEVQFNHGLLLLEKKR